MLENESAPEGADTQNDEADEGHQEGRVAVISGMTLSPACVTFGKVRIVVIGSNIPESTMPYFIGKHTVISGYAAQTILDVIKIQRKNRNEWSLFHGLGVCTSLQFLAYLIMLNFSFFVIDLCILCQI